LTDYAVTLAPWAAYVAFSNALGSWRDGFIIGLATSALLVLARTIHRDSRFIDIGTLVYCAVLATISTIDPGSPVRAYNLPLSMSMVGGLSAASLAIRSPFTYRIARDHVPRAVLDDPEHHRQLFHAHVIATSVWAGGQLLAAGASALLVFRHQPGFAIAVQAVGTLVPVAATRYQHERVTESLPQISQIGGLV
jgi:hypothetical protein